MDIADLDIPPVTQVEYEGLIRERSYLLPHIFKYVAWFIILASVVSSSVVLILYGMSFGMVKSYLWLAAFMGSFLITVFFSVPIKIFLFSFIKAFCIKKKPMIIKRKINTSLLSNPANQEKKKQILRSREINANLYTPTPLHKLQNRLDDIKYNLELRNLATDIAVYALFLLTSLYIVLFSKSPMAFYTNDVILEGILNGSYTNSVHFDDMVTYDGFLDYVNETLLPSLLPGYKDSSQGLRGPNRGRRSARDNIFARRNPASKFKKRQLLNDFEDVNKPGARRDIFSRGWTMNPNLKLLGRPRLRQVRVRTDSCKEVNDLEARNVECAAPLNVFNVETGDFGLSWSPPPPVGLEEAQASPWKYQSAWKTGTLPTVGRITTYPAGGYVLNLARNIDDARIVLGFLDAFQWVDIRTRAVFVDFTLYCVNTNLFSVVTLLAERSADGYFITSCQTHTCKFLILNSEFEFLVITMTVLFGLLMFFFLLRESLRIHRTSFKPYICRGMAVIDLAVIFLGVLSLIFVILRSIYVSSLLKTLEEAQNNAFVSFDYAAFWHSWSVYLEALLVCFASVKLFRPLTFRVAFFQLQITLVRCFRLFIDLIFQELVFVVAFAFFFNLTLVYFTEGFSSFGLALTAIMGRAVPLDTTYDHYILSSAWYVGPLFFSLFAVIVCILFVNIFIAVICLYFRKIREADLVDKYDLGEFIKHYLTSRRQEDIVRTREERVFRDRASEANLMRLKGGGNKTPKEKHKVKEETVQGEIAEAYLKDFVTRKPFDTTEYVDLAVDREAAMRHLMMMFLSEHEEVRKMSCENTLRTLFYSFTSDRRSLEQQRGEYFYVEKKSGLEIVDRRVFPKMKKLVEDFGRENGLLVEEEYEEMAKREDELELLERKLCLLLKKLCK